MIQEFPSIVRFPPTQPPSYKPPEFRKSQLLRQYASLIRSTPLMVLFQHNNLKSSEWTGIRRELNKALRKVDEARVTAGLPAENLGGGVKIQIIQTGIFASALKIVDFYRPQSPSFTLDPTHPSTPSSAIIPNIKPEGSNLTHSLSEAAHAASNKKSHTLAPLMSGPIALLTFPTVSPEHLKAALSILAPVPGQFPAPTRKANPGWHDLPVQTGLQKLLLLGARVEGKVFDIEGTKWVGSINGGLEGLRGQLVAMLQGISGNLTNTLESAGKNLYFTVEGRRTMLADEEKGSLEDKAEEAIKVQ
jgi:large subunit ribosomal protein L10